MELFLFLHVAHLDQDTLFCDDETEAEFEWCTRWTEKLFNEVFHSLFEIILVSLQKNPCCTTLREMMQSESHWMSWENGNFHCHTPNKLGECDYFHAAFMLHTWDGLHTSRHWESIQLNTKAVLRVLTSHNNNLDELNSLYNTANGANLCRKKRINFVYMFQLTHSWWWSVWLVGGEWCSSGRREESWVERGEKKTRRTTRRSEDMLCWIFQHRLNDYTRRRSLSDVMSGCGTLLRRELARCDAELGLFCS